MISDRTMEHDPTIACVGEPGSDDGLSNGDSTPVPGESVVK